MKLVVGLGNPGRRYRDTRHNVGFRIVERLAERHGIVLGVRRFQGRFGSGRIRDIEVGVLEPQTYMNASGESVAEAVNSLPLGEPSRDLLVVYDDVDLPFGRIRVRPSGGDGGHQGMRDVIASVGRQDFPRLRFGVGRPAGSWDTVTHVLQPFTPEERAALEGHVERAAHAIETMVVEGVELAMSRFNAPAEA